MSAHDPFAIQQTPLEDAPPQPVLPLHPRRTLLPLAILLPAVVGIVLAILRVMHPLVVISQQGDATLYEISSPHLTITSGILALATIVAIGSLFLRSVRNVTLLAVTVLVLCIGLGLTLLHHRSAKVVLTPVSLTAPLRAHGILPEDSFTLRFDKMQMLQFIGDPDRWEKNYQRIYTGFGPGGEVEINIGPLFRAVHDELVARAAQYGVRVVH